MKFKVGDKVRIIKKVPYEDGWGNSWNDSEMDKFVNDGVVYTVGEVDDSGVYFEGADSGVPGNNWFGWPHGALELADKQLFHTGAEV